MASYRVLITGSRAWGNIDTIKEAFDQAERLNVHGFQMVLIHGAAAGADTIGAMIAEHRGWRVEAYPAQWETHVGKGGLMPCPDWHWPLPKCKMAGHRRNQQMINTGADICLAFIKNFSNGATGCADKAQAARIPTKVWRE